MAFAYERGVGTPTLLDWELVSSKWSLENDSVLSKGNQGHDSNVTYNTFEEPRHLCGTIRYVTEAKGDVRSPVVAAGGKAVIKGHL